MALPGYRMRQSAIRKDIFAPTGRCLGGRPCGRQRLRNRPQPALSCQKI